MTTRSLQTFRCVGLVAATIALVSFVVTLPRPKAGYQHNSVSHRGLHHKKQSSLSLVLNQGSYRWDDWWDDYYSDDSLDDNPYYNDDYTFVYTPVDTKYIRPTNGGYGGRRGRSIADLRFNKCPPVIEGYQTNAWRYGKSRDYIQGVHKSVFPLMPNDYPISGQKATILRHETMADSVVIPGDVQLHDSKGSRYWLNGNSIKPVYPGDGGFWDEMRQVVDVQIARRNGASPSTLNTWPNIWTEKRTLDDIAKAVQGEYPAFHQQSLIEKMFKDGIEMYHDMGPFRSVVDFIGTEIRIASINTWTFEAVAPVNFMLKWHVGMPRPEEVAWMIYTDAFTSSNDGVPEDLVTSIKSMNLQHAADFTAYEDGSPMHPSFPAMHSAGSTCSFWLPAICKVTPEQFCEALRVDYAVAYGRTVAGVHYQQDNLAGLNIGQQIIKEQLPDMLAAKYGYDSALVASKLEALSFDWNTFDSAACTIGGLSSAEFLANAGR